MFLDPTPVVAPVVDGISHQYINAFITAAFAIVAGGLGFAIMRFIKGVDRLEKIVPDMQSTQQIHTLLIGQHEGKIEYLMQNRCALSSRCDDYQGPERRSSPRDGKTTVDINEEYPFNRGPHESDPIL